MNGEAWAFLAGAVFTIPPATWAGLRWGEMRGRDKAISSVAEGT